MKLTSLGHSDKTLKEFLNKLIENKIEIVVDVRSKPYSSRVPHFNRHLLQESLSKIGILYLFRGCNLGGLGKNVDFDKAIDEVCRLSEDANVVMVCSESDYRKCHRYNTLTPALLKNGVSVSHITWDTKNVNEYEKNVTRSKNEK